MTSRDSVRSEFSVPIGDASVVRVVVLEPVVREQASVLGNLFELYAHDFSETVPLHLGPDGRFGLAPGERWWSDGDRTSSDATRGWPGSR